MGYSKGGRSQSTQNSQVVYPSPFLDLFNSQFGQGVGFNELLGALPQTQSLFGGGPVGYGPLAGGGGSTAGTPGAAGAPAGGQTGTGTRGVGTGTVPFSQISALVAQQFPNDPVRQSRLNRELQTWAQQGGHDLNAIPIEALRSSPQLANRPNFAGFLTSQLPATLDSLQQGQGDPRFGAYGGADLSGLDVNNRIKQLFAPAQQAQQFQFQNIPGITAPIAQAGQMDIAPGGFDRYEQAIYQSQFDPTRRALTQEGALADERLQAELAQSGLASSGSGQGQLQEQRRQRSEQLMAASQQAANQATQQRFGAEFAQSQFNAQQRQATSLANAGFDLDAQKTNATNILAGDTLRSENYLKTIGLNNESANLLRDDFLGLLGIAQADLQRLSQFQQENLGMLLNNWLQQGALLGNLGQQGQQQSNSGGGFYAGISLSAGNST